MYEDSLIYLLQERKYKTKDIEELDKLLRKLKKLNIGTSIAVDNDTYVIKLVPLYYNEWGVILYYNKEDRFLRDDIVYDNFSEILEGLVNNEKFKDYLIDNNLVEYVIDTQTGNYYDFDSILYEEAEKYIWDNIL